MPLEGDFIIWQLKVLEPTSLIEKESIKLLLHSNDGFVYKYNNNCLLEFIIPTT